jgi:pimeloyl-ACP methyl ester carboxylesterase
LLTESRVAIDLKVPFIDCKGLFVARRRLKVVEPMKINVERAGPNDGHDIVLVHGAGGSAATWFMQLKGLGDVFRVHALELNGHGESEDRNESDTRHAYLEDVDSVTSEISRPILGGHSMGGALTQLYALSHPNSVSGIVLIGTGARLRVAPGIFDLLENDFDTYVQALGGFMFDSRADPRLIEASRVEASRCSPEVISRDFRMCDEFDIMREVSHISVPALVIVGESDVMTPPKYSQFLADSIEGAELRIIPEAGHAVMLEQPGMVNSAIKEWAQRLVVRG